MSLTPDEPEIPRERELPYVVPVTRQPSWTTDARDAPDLTRRSANASLTRGLLVVLGVEAALFVLVLLATLVFEWVSHDALPFLLIGVVVLISPALVAVVLRHRRRAPRAKTPGAGAPGTSPGPSSDTGTASWPPASDAGSYLPGGASAIVAPPGVAEYGFPVAAPVPLRLPIEDVFTIRGRGVVVVGVVAQGRVTVGDHVTVTRGGLAVVSTEVVGVEKFRSQVEEAEVGETVGLLLADVTRDQVAAGDVVEG